MGAAELSRNKFKHAILGGQQQIGLWVSLVSAYSAEIVAGSGFDWLLIDTEHSPAEVASVLPQLQAVASYSASAIVRPAWNDKVLVKRHLDLGVQTLLIPYVSTPDEAAAAVAAMRYPPRGVRGVAGSTRAARFGRIKDYATRCEEELCLLVQVETRLGLDNLEKIAAVDGVDGVFIGPADLAAGLGHTGEIGHPEVQSAIFEGIRRIRASGKAPGILAMDEAFARKSMEAGTLFTAVGLDASLLARESDKLAARFKQKVGATF